MALDLVDALQTACEEAKPLVGRGRVATYIPALARVDPNQLGLALVTKTGELYTHGDAHIPFSIQSFSKVFSLAMTLSRRGKLSFSRWAESPPGILSTRLCSWEHDDGVPRNPFINAGAIVVSHLLLGRRAPEEAVRELTEFVGRCADDPTIRFDPEVAHSEARTGERNRSLAYFSRQAAPARTRSGPDEGLYDKVRSSGLEGYGFAFRRPVRSVFGPTERRGVRMTDCSHLHS